MDRFTYVTDVPRTEEGFHQLSWRDGERPDWWREHYANGLWHSSLWQFRNDRHWFVFADLSEAETLLTRMPTAPSITGDFSAVQEAVLRELFFGVPLADGAPTSQVFHFEVARTGVGLFLREQWPRLNRKRAEVTRLESYLNPLLIGVGNELADAGAIDVLLDPENGVGVPLRYLKDLALNTDAYELRNVLADVEEQQAAARAAAKVEEAAAKEVRAAQRREKADLKRERERMRQFMGYLALDDFTPLNDNEATAVQMYREWQDNTETPQAHGLRQQLEEFVLTTVIREDKR